MDYTVKIIFILKSPFDHEYVDEFATGLHEAIKVENAISLKFGNNITDITPLIISIATAYSEGLIGAIGEKSLDFVLSKLNIFLKKYCARRQSTDLKIEITEGKNKYQFEAKDVTEQNVDNALIEFRTIVLGKEQ